MSATVRRSAWEELRVLLAERFTPAELYAWLWGRYEELRAYLPTPGGAVPAEYAFAVLQRLDGDGLVNDEFFAALAEQIATLAAQLAEATAERDAARGQVAAQWLKIYDTLAMKRGYAVSPVVKGVCQGCHMALPPQLNNILARLQSVETCPRCHRLIYRKELFDADPAAPAEAAEPAKT